MVKYINLMLQASKHIGEVKEMAMTEACAYAPKCIKVTGTTADGEKFAFHLEVGECKRDS